VAISLVDFLQFILARVFAKQTGFLAQRATAQRSLGSDEFTARTQTDRTCETVDGIGTTPPHRARRSTAAYAARWIASSQGLLAMTVEDP
jgi:hypothetical protein